MDQSHRWEVAHETARAGGCPSTVPRTGARPAARAGTRTVPWSNPTGNAGSGSRAGTWSVHRRFSRPTAGRNLTTGIRADVERRWRAVPTGHLRAADRVEGETLSTVR